MSASDRRNSPFSYQYSSQPFQVESYQDPDLFYALVGPWPFVFSGEPLESDKAQNPSASFAPGVISGLVPAEWLWELPK